MSEDHIGIEPWKKKCPHCGYYQSDFAIGGHTVCDGCGGVID